MPNILGIVGLCVGILAFICSILAVALPYWQVLDQNNVEAHIGLWEFCYETSETETCQDTEDALTDDYEDALNATRAMVILGLISIVGAIITVIILVFVMKDKKIIGFISGALAIAGGLFHMIAMAVYVGEIGDDVNDAFDYGSGFAFDILAWLVAWIAGAIIIFAAIKGGGGVGSS